MFTWLLRNTNIKEIDVDENDDNNISDDYNIFVSCQSFVGLSSLGVGGLFVNHDDDDDADDETAVVIIVITMLI